MQDERHDDMIPIAEALALLCTLGTYGNAPYAVLASDYSRSIRDSAGEEAAESGIQVLLVEDDPADGLLLQEILAAAKFVLFQVTHVTQLSAALQHLAAEHCDVVLLDLSLPDSHGLQTFATLHTQAPGVPIVVLTGLDDETVAVEAVQEGAQDYLVKGQVDGNGLVRAMRYAIERQRAEAALRQDWLAVTLASIGDAVIATDMHGLVTFINPVAAMLTGWTEQDALGYHIDTVYRLVHEQSHQHVDSPAARVLREGITAGFMDHTALLTRDGRAISIADSAAPIRSRDGRLQGMVLVCRDISERKQLEAQLRQAQKMEAIGTLAGGIAHDFNNILAAILGFSELASYEVPQASAVWDHLQNVLRAGKRAKELVQQILAFSRRTMAERRPVQLQLLIKETLTLLRASLPSTIEIKHSLATDVGTVLADPIQMHQVLMNLCANAQYAMRDTGGMLEVRLEATEADPPVTCPDLKPGPYVRLTVRDTGPGITPEALGRLFEPFFTTKSPGEGTGMGLAVVHGIVASHDGAITVSSTPGQGATFEIYLPRLAEAVIDDPHSEERIPEGKGRILFVDDEDPVVRLSQEILERLGYEVVACGDSLEALQAFQEASQRFDLVITDQTMPRMTGDMLVQALRRIRPDIPIILCTGFSYTINAEQAEALGIDAWLTKPWQTRDLAHTIQHVLAQRRRQDS
jgi:PAS domain S-box-containing protein